MELAPSRNTSPKEAIDPANRSSSASILRPPLTAPRSFVLAALRALPHDPAGGLTAARLYGGTARNTETISFVGIDRPHSFRDDTQRNPSGRGRVVAGVGRVPAQSPAAAVARYRSRRQPISSRPRGGRRGRSSSTGSARPATARPSWSSAGGPTGRRPGPPAPPAAAPGPPPAVPSLRRRWPGRPGRGRSAGAGRRPTRATSPCSRPGGPGASRWW
jgi:hypothetical protein